MTVGERICRRRKQLEITQEELAFKVGYKTKSSINKIELGVNDTTPSKLVKIAEALNTTPAYLMGWEEEEKPTMIVENIIPMPDMKKVPLLGTIACGEPILAQENIEEEVDIPAHIHADFALRCKGDSMIDARIYDGDIVYIRQQPTVENGQIAAVLIDNEATLKRVYLSDETLTLMACNQKYQPFFFSGEQLNDIRILGIAVGFTSKI